MRKTVLTAAMAATVLTMAACSESTDEATDASAESAMAGSGSGDDVAEELIASSVLNANTATAEVLANVQGVSPELAETIAAGQPFTSVVDLNAVLLSSLTPEEAAEVLTSVFVPVNLNTASEEELNLIPGMTDRMKHEFEEYRPYKDMGEFNREIGKYVDEAEVARFRNYVTL